MERNLTLYARFRTPLPILWVANRNQSNFHDSAANIHGQLDTS